jgi:cytochrome c oxidase subunit 2
MNELLRRILFLPEQASTFARQVDQLHYFVILTTMIASTAVGLTSLLFFVRYRRRTDDQTTAPVPTPLWVELVIILVPATFFLTWFGMGFSDFLTFSTPPRDATDIYVMGKQWMWKFSYPKGPSSVDVLRVPQGRPVRLLMTSRDVIHSFYVPAFRIKRDVIPGRYTEVWFEATTAGRFPVLCTEYCGTNHSLMRAEVEVLPEAEFDRWMDSQRPDEHRREGYTAERANEVAFPSDLAAQGERLALQQGCFKCHSVDGSAHIGPTWLDLYGRTEQLESGARVVADEAYLTRSMMDPRADVVAGFRPVMPAFQGRLTASDTAALLEFIKTLRSDLPVRIPSQEPVYERIRAR